VEAAPRCLRVICSLSSWLVRPRFESLVSFVLAKNVPMCLTNTVIDTHTHTHTHTVTGQHISCWSVQLGRVFKLATLLPTLEARNLGCSAQ
jgi:hypothetical protein